MSNHQENTNKMIDLKNNNNQVKFWSWQVQ